MTYVYQVLLSSTLQLTSYSLNYHIKNSLPEVTCCCLQICNVAASEEIVGDTCIPSLIVINTTINQLESKVSLITTHCLRLFVVVYKHAMFWHQR